MGVEAIGQIVGGKKRHGTGLTQSRSPHHAQIHPADRKDSSTPECCSGHRADCSAGWRSGQGMARQEWGEVSRHTDRTDTRTSTAMGNAEGLVQVEMTDICPVGARSTKADLSIEVGAIEIDLSSVGMDQIADAANARLKHTMGGWVGHHESRKPVGMVGHPGDEILLINVAVRIASHWNNPKPSHHCTGWVGAMSTCGDQANIPVPIPSGQVPGPNHQKSGIFTLGSGIRLK